MIYRLLLICLLISASRITAESYYERGRSDGTELAHHIYSLIVKSDIVLPGGTGEPTAPLRDFLAQESIDTALHSEAFAEFKAYYEGFYEAFIHHANVELYQSSSLKPPLKEWIHHLYKTTCQIYLSALSADTFAAADREQCAIVKKNISTYLTHTRPALTLPIQDIVIVVPTNRFYIQGQETGITLSLRLVQACATYEHPSRIRDEFMEQLRDPLIDKDSSTEEHTQAFRDLKQFFAGLKEQFMRYTPGSVEMNCREFYLPEQLIERCKLYHDYLASTIELILGSSSWDEVMHAGKDFVRHYESRLTESELQECSTFAQLTDLACSIEEGLIFDELLG